MNMSLPVLKVRMLGKESFVYNDQILPFGRNSVTKVKKLFMLLLYSGKKGIERNKLIENLYGREEMMNVANNLRVTMHRLKKLMVQSGFPEHEYVLLKDGVYYWDSPMDVEIDAHVFEDLIAEARQIKDKERKNALLKKACLMYRGEFLQSMSGEEWVLFESMRLKELYSEALQEVCTYLKEKREYEEVIRLAEMACEIYPFDEWQAVKMECYNHLNRYKDALKEYKDTAKFMFEELGVSPSQKMMDLFDEMSKHIGNRPQMIAEIKNGLQEQDEEGGAFFCTVPGFRDAFRLTKRTMERNGVSVFLLVCTLVNGKGHPMESSPKLNEMSDVLYRAIQKSLRRSDSFTKYNESKYLVMLMGTNEENCQIVINRITKCFTEQHKSWGQYLVCEISSLYDI